MTVPTSKEIVSLYRDRAEYYDFTANLYYLVGFREWTYRKKAVEALNLKRGDTVVEIGCGTGLNFSLLERDVGAEGRIIGVDLTDSMLAQARKRVESNAWSNIELVHEDAAAFQFPSGVDGIISTFAITLAPEFDKAIQNGCTALKPGKRWVILDFKMPSNWLAFLAPLAILITRPFGVTKELAERHPWESIERHLKNSTLTEFYGGFAYLVTGECGQAGCCGS